MANESRVFRLPAGMSTQVVANAVEAFLSAAKGMEVQSAETTEGYVVQGRQEKDGWKTIAGMRMATTVQMIRMDDNLNVTVGQGEWSDKIGAGALGWFIAWPLAVTAGVGAYKQKKLPEETEQYIELDKVDTRTNELCYFQKEEIDVKKEDQTEENTENKN